MKKILFTILAIFLFQISGISNSIPEFLTPIKIVENLYAIENPHGGNIAFLVTDEGIIVVDAGSSLSNSTLIVTAIKAISDKPIKYLVYTHLHGDHVNGASEFPVDVKIIAHEKIVENFKNINEPELKKDIMEMPEYLAKLNYLMDSISDKKSDEYLKMNQQFNLYSSYVEELKTVRVRYPDTTFTEKLELTLGKEKVILEFPGSGHTNDNIIVRFPRQNAIHTGDLIFNGSIPYVIASHGASVKGWTSIVDKLYTENIKYVIPGHGKITNNDAFKIQAEYFKKLTEKVSALKAEGKSLDEIKSGIDVKEFGLIGSEDQFPVNIEVIYNEL